MIKVLNEENHALRLLEEGFILDNKVGYELSLLAKYYIHRQGLNRPQTKNKLIEFCNTHLENFDAINWRNTINRSVENGKKLNFINVNEVTITESELNVITSIKSSRCQKILFVLLVIAKTNNKLNKIVAKQKNKDYEDIYYVNDSISSIVKLSKTSLKSDERYKILKELQDLGYIEVTTKGKFKINIVNDSSEIKLHINRLDDFIYDYLIYIGQKVKVCEGEGCNKRILVKNNKNKYCKECAKEQKRLNNKENMRKYRDVVK
ncbi:hypothetical protein ACSW8L_15880 (plasmid) [Clostridium perfringens]